MSASDATNQVLPASQDPTGALCRRSHSLLPRFIEARIRQEANPHLKHPLPPGVNLDLRPWLPPAGKLTLRLYLNRRYVDSYQLLFNTLALANPN